MKLIFGDYPLLKILLIVMIFLAAVYILLIFSDISFPASGVITGKNFEPSRTDTILVFTGKVFIPQTRITPDKWYFTVNSCENDDCDLVTFGVDKTTFDNYEIGDWYNSEHEDG